MAEISRKGGGFRKIYGHFMVLVNDRGDDYEEDEESDGEDFMDLGDYNIYSSSSIQIQAKPLKSHIVQFREYGNGLVHTVEGNFQIKDPWWAATIEVRNRRGRKNLYRRYPKYSLRNDPSLHEVMATFFSTCGVITDHSSAFLTELDNMGLKKSLSFENLIERVELYEQSGGDPGIADSICSAMRRGPGELVSAYEDHKILYEYLPQLLPRQFLGIMVYDQSEDEVDDSTETGQEKLRRIFKKKQQHATIRRKMLVIIEESPWMIGFSCVVQAKCGLAGCEANLDKLYLSGIMDKISGVEKDSLHIYDALKHCSRQYGHTFVTLDKLKSNKMFDEYSIEYKFKLNGKSNRWQPALEFLEVNRVIVRETIQGDKRIYLTKYYKAEKMIAENVEHLLKQDKSEPSTFEIDYESPLFSSVKKDPCQVEAAEMIRQNPVVCINGKGGCGKTTVVSAVFKHLEGIIKKNNWSGEDADLQNETLNDTAFDEMLSQCAKEAETSIEHEDSLEPESQLTRNPSDVEDVKSDTEQDPDAIRNKDNPIIALSAPTGKAANLIGQRAQLPSFTLHSIVMSYHKWKFAKPDETGKKNPWKFHRVEALVVDECSLVSVCIFSNMLKALIDESKLKRLVLLGDVHQLPSIDAGNFLSDMYNSLNEIGLSVKLMNNHRSDAQLIVENANSIQGKKMPVFEPKRNFHLKRLSDNDGQDRDKMVEDLLYGRNPDLRSHENSQFVAFRNKDCDAINEKCCQFYAKHSTKNHKGRNDFRVGDKICCTKNGSIADQFQVAADKKTKAPKASDEGNNGVASTSINNGDVSTGEPGPKINADVEEEEVINGCKAVKLCNGEIFFIRDVTDVEERGKKNTYFVLDDLQRKVKVNFRDLQRMCRPKHAWARTIHTYQGSESDSVIYVVGSGKGQTWQHVYTAVTRGKTQVVIITTEDDLSEAIGRAPMKRNTSLRERIQRIDPSLRPASYKQRTSSMTPTKSQHLRDNKYSKPIDASKLKISDENENLTMAVSAVHQSEAFSSDSHVNNLSNWSELGEDMLDWADNIESQSVASSTPSTSFSLQPSTHGENVGPRRFLFSGPHSPRSSDSTVKRGDTSVSSNAVDSGDSLLDSSPDGPMFEKWLSPKRKRSGSQDESPERIIREPPTHPSSFESPVRRNLERFSFR